MSVGFVTPSALPLFSLNPPLPFPLTLSPFLPKFSLPIFNGGPVHNPEKFWKLKMNVRGFSRTFDTINHSDRLGILPLHNFKEIRR